MHVSLCCSLASQPYFSPCAHARMISGWGEGRGKVFFPSLAPPTDHTRMRTRGKIQPACQTNCAVPPCSDKLFPSFGFGAKIGDKVSHEFPLNGNWENPYCAGIASVIQAYHQSLQRVQLYGPTNVAPIINHVASFAEKAAASEQQGGSPTQVNTPSCCIYSAIKGHSRICPVKGTIQWPHAIDST